MDQGISFVLAMKDLAGNHDDPGEAIELQVDIVTAAIDLSAEAGLPLVVLLSLSI
jgi:hypothetical protein